jgi:hypothetical protein
MAEGRHGLKHGIKEQAFRNGNMSRRTSNG